MVEFFALSVINAVNAQLDNIAGREVYLKPDVDAQNAIECDYGHGVVMWKVAAYIEFNHICLTEIILDNGDLVVENFLSFATIKEVVEHIALHVNRLV